MRRLISDCGLEDRLELLPAGFRTAIRRDGRWHELDYQSPELGLARYSGLGLRDTAALGRLLPYQLRALPAMRFFDMASAAAIDSHSMEDVVGRVANRYFAAALAEVFCNYAPAEMSLAFGVLGSRFPTRRAWTMRGGIGALAHALAGGLDVRCGVVVERVDARRGGIVVETRGGESFESRAAILATGAHESLALWPDAPESTRRFLSGQSYTQGLGVFLRTREPVRAVDRRGRDLALRILPRGEGGDHLLSVVYRNEAAPDGGLILLDAYASAAAAIADDAELAARLEAELAEVHPEASELVADRRVVRWDPFVPAFPAGRARELAGFRRTLAPGPIQLAGDYLCGPLMEGAVRSAEDAADRARAHLGR